MRTYLIGIKALNTATIMTFAAHNRSGFAGILDLVICHENRHDITVEEGPAVNIILSELRSTIIQDVTKLEHHLFNIQDADGHLQMLLLRARL